MQKLDKRMTMLAALVRQGSRLLDIGTDHAYLPAHLIESGRCSSACAADIGIGPLGNARDTVTKHGLQSKISLFLSDGFDSVPENCADDIVIAGMGGTLMAELLARCGWIKKDGIRLILQPMTHAQEVRRFLYSEGFRITKEVTCLDGKRVYLCLCAEYDGVRRDVPFGKLFIGEPSLCEGSPESKKAYLKKQLKWLGEKIKALELTGKDEKQLNEYSAIESELSDLLIKYDLC